MAASAINFWNCIAERTASRTSCSLPRVSFFEPGLHHESTMQH